MCSLKINKIYFIIFYYIIEYIMIDPSRLININANAQIQSTREARAQLRRARHAK